MANFPSIMFLDDKKRKNYVDVRGSITLGKGETCSCKLPKIEAVDNRHLVIFEENGEFFVKNLSHLPVSVNSVMVNRGEKKALGHKTTFTFGRSGDPENYTIATWEDKRRPVKSITKAFQPKHFSSDVQSVRININAEKNKNLGGEIEFLREHFYSGFQNIEPNPRKVCDYITNFIQTYFSSFTVVIFRKLGGRWRGVSSKRLDKRQEYGPARQIFFQAAEEKVPFLAKVQRGASDKLIIGDQEQDASMTVVNLPVDRVIYVPLIQNNKCFGMLYFDSQDREVDERDLEKITRLFNDNGLTAILSGYLVDDKWELGFLKEEVKLHKSRDWRFIIKNNNIHYPVVSSKIMDGMGCSRVVYGFCGDNLSIATKCKAYIQALQDTNTTMDNHSYLKHLRDFVLGLSDSISAGMIDFFYDYPTPSVGEIEDEFRLKTIDVENEEDDREEGHNVQIDWIGPVHIYIGRSGVISKVATKTTESPIKVNGFLHGDFVIGSLFTIDIIKLEKIWDKPNFLELMNKLCKDYCLLVREK